MLISGEIKFIYNIWEIDSEGNHIRLAVYKTYLIDIVGTSPILRGRRLPVTQPSQLPSEAETRPSNSPDIFALLEQDNYRITLVSS